ncbi:MAG: glycosyltransferase family 2 protein [Caldilineaceae bacterium]
MKLAVIILNYNTRDLLRQCLHSVLTSAALTQEHLTVELWVVDNASPDGSATMVTAEFPQVRLLASQRNLGYTGGNNWALTQLGFPVDEQKGLRDLAPTQVDVERPDFVLLLNADTEIVGDALWQMAKVLSTEPTAGVCGAHLAYGDGSFQHGAFAFPSLWQVALDFFPFAGVRGAQRLHNSAINGRYAAKLWQGQQPFPVDFVLGAALMVRREAILQVGGLDDDFFMYCEEMDWCLRIQKAGWEVYVAPAAHVTHYEGQSSRQVRWPAYVQLWRSRFRFYMKHHQLYPAYYMDAVRVLIRLGLWRRTQTAWHRFQHGQLSGRELAEELSAYVLIRQL